eukprot:c21635_g1_i1 orf=401-925(-)
MAAAPLPLSVISFSLILLFHLATRLLLLLLPRENVHPEQRQLAREIKDLLRNANALSTPSTFSKAAKLRRAAAVKEKELAQFRKNSAEQRHWSKLLWFLQPLLKCIFYISLGCWFWGVPVAHIPSNLLRPLGDLLSWRSENGTSQDYVTVGILPWMVLSTRTCIFLSEKMIPWL